MCLNKITQDLDTNIYLNAALELGYRVEVVDEDASYATVQNQDKVVHIHENWLSINDQVAYAFARDKYTSNQVLQKELPELFPETVCVDLHKPTEWSEALDFAEEELLQVVVKPNSASLGAGVSILPESKKALEQVLKSLAATYSKAVIQKYLGKLSEYRIVLVKGKFFDAIRRIPAYVVGDGKKTVEQLILMKNEQRSLYSFPLIRYDSSIENILKSHHVSLTTVLNQNQRVQLRSVCTFAQGGETERVVPESIHSEFLESFTKIAQTSRLEFLGIDLMCEDISRAPYVQQCGVNEINSGPMADLHFFADLKEGTPLQSTKKLLRMLLE